MTYHELEQNATVGDFYKEMTGIINHAPNTSIYKVTPYVYAGLMVVTDQQKAEKIISIVRKYYGVDNPFKISKNNPHKLDRSIEFAGPRHAIRYLIKKHTKLSLKAIGRMTGGADHSTIIASIDRFQNWIDTEKKVRQQLSDLEAMFKAL